MKENEVHLERVEVGGSGDGADGGGSRTILKRSHTPILAVSPNFSHPAGQAWIHWPVIIHDHNHGKFHGDPGRHQRAGDPRVPKIS